MSLLTQALAIHTANKRVIEDVTEEMLELAIAYVHHEVTFRQVAKAIGIKESAVQSKMLQTLAVGVRSGKLVVAK